MATAEAMATQVLAELSGTPYACTSLAPLAGGFANFTYRGRLRQRLAADGSESIVIKHAEPFVAANAAVALDVTRSHYEQTMLAALASLPPTQHANVLVTTPRLHHYASTPAAATLVLEDYVAAVELKDYLTRHRLAAADVARLGIALGAWLQSFHAWGAAQTQLRAALRERPGMKRMKTFLNSGRLLQTVERFPELLEESRPVLEEIAERYRREAEESDGELIHGDFWSGNILLRDGPLPPPSPSASAPPLRLLIIDWEFAQLASRAFDLGQCLAELFLLSHFRGIAAGADMLPAFMTGYGALDDDAAFRVALAFGVHLIVWPCRVPGWGAGAPMEACVRFGRDCCVRAWERDSAWFRDGVLRALFESDKIHGREG